MKSELAETPNTVRRRLLHGELPPTGPSRSAAVSLRTLILAARRFAHDLGFEKAASLAYSSLLALVPTALLAVSVVELLGAEKQENFLTSMLGIVLPKDDRLRANVMELINESRNVFAGATGTATVRILSLAMLVYFAGSVLATVDRVVAHIWGGGGFRVFVRRLSAYWAVITLGPLLLALSFLASAFAEDLLGSVAGGAVRGVFPFAVSSVAIYLFYRLMPHSPCRPRAALIASVVAGTLWEASKLGLAWWFARPHASLMTKLSFFPMALLWMYVSWAIVIYGLEVAFVVHHGTWREGLARTTDPRLGAARELLAVALAIEVARCHDEGRAPDRAVLADTLGAADNDVRAALDNLMAAGVLTTAASGALIPARGADGVPAVLVLRAVRGHAAERPLSSSAPAALVAAAFLERAEAGGRLPIDAETLGSLVRSSRALSTPEARGGPPIAS